MLGKKRISPNESLEQSIYSIKSEKSVDLKLYHEENLKDTTKFVLLPKVKNESKILNENVDKLVQTFSLEIISKNYNAFNKKCGICKKELSKKKKENYYLTCGHPFHTACIRNTVNKKKNDVILNLSYVNDQENANNNQDESLINRMDQELTYNINILENYPREFRFFYYHNDLVNELNANRPSQNQGFDENTSYLSLSSDSTTQVESDSGKQKRVRCFVCNRVDPYFHKFYQSALKNVLGIKSLFEEFDELQQAANFFEEIRRYLKIFFSYWFLYIFISMVKFLLRLIF